MHLQARADVVLGYEVAGKHVHATPRSPVGAVSDQAAAAKPSSFCARSMSPRIASMTDRVSRA